MTFPESPSITGLVEITVTCMTRQGHDASPSRIQGPGGCNEIFNLSDLKFEPAGLEDIYHRRWVCQGKFG